MKRWLLNDKPLKPLYLLEIDVYRGFYFVISAAFIWFRVQFAVSWYRNDYTIRAIEMLVKADVKTNIHFVLHEEPMAEVIYRLKEKAFPEGINAVIILLHKPIGLGAKEKIICTDNKNFAEFVRYISGENMAYKVRVDS
ncbi:hypothetical protein [Bariatricus sp. HCP28S3_D3]|uniref:hypothetical protein n=1 Tax=Bariatricus sp. HCP28S3_D3 TaxID=3438901 RepID=UPI002A78DBB4|nr:hypothetical protein [Bariatricus sp.]